MRYYVIALNKKKYGNIHILLKYDFIHIKAILRALFLKMSKKSQNHVCEIFHIYDLSGFYLILTMIDQMKISIIYFTIFIYNLLNLLLKK